MPANGSGLKHQFVWRVNISGTLTHWSVRCRRHGVSAARQVRPCLLLAFAFAAAIECEMAAGMSNHANTRRRLAARIR